MNARSLREFEAAARERLDPARYDYFAGGAGDEATAGDNEAAFGRLRLVPRVLRGAAQLQTGVTLLGSRAAMPVLVARPALDHGAAAITVSDHGGRQLDGVPAPIDLLRPKVEHALTLCGCACVQDLGPGMVRRSC